MHKQNNNNNQRLRKGNLHALLVEWIDVARRVVLGLPIKVELVALRDLLRLDGAIFVAEVLLVHEFDLFRLLERRLGRLAHHFAERRDKHVGSLRVRRPRSTASSPVVIAAHASGSVARH